MYFVGVNGRSPLQILYVNHKLKRIYNVYNPWENLRSVGVNGRSPLQLKCVLAYLY